MSERILYKGPCISNDTWVTGLNNNDCIIGPSGTGKTRGYVLPNILQCSESVIVTSVKDSLCKKTGRALRKNGYQVIEINFQDCAASRSTSRIVPLLPMGTIRSCMCAATKSVGAAMSRTFFKSPPPSLPSRQRTTRFGSRPAGHSSNCRRSLPGQDKERPVLGAGCPDGPLSHDFLCAGVSATPGASSGQCDPAPAGDGERQL